MGILSPHSLDFSIISDIFFSTSTSVIIGVILPSYPVVSSSYGLGIGFFVTGSSLSSPPYHSFVLMSLYVGHGCIIWTRANPLWATAFLTVSLRCFVLYE